MLPGSLRVGATRVFRICSSSFPLPGLALKNASTLGYFNSAQAITDYAEILLYIKEKFNARHSPVIVIGGSYGGSKLASHASSSDSCDEKYEMNVINGF